VGAGRAFPRAGEGFTDIGGCAGGGRRASGALAARLSAQQPGSGLLPTKRLCSVQKDALCLRYTCTSLRSRNHSRRNPPIASASPAWAAFAAWGLDLNHGCGRNALAGLTSLAGSLRSADRFIRSWEIWVFFFFFVPAAPMWEKVMASSSSPAIRRPRRLRQSPGSAAAGACGWRRQR